MKRSFEATFPSWILSINLQRASLETVAYFSSQLTNFFFFYRLVGVILFVGFIFAPDKNTKLCLSGFIFRNK
uniref:Uncharacterized protein n=1 Tax=Octopus bimaculoides TaxID=37653 RepID=A0A0L8FLS9_OCTBM